MPVSSRDLYYQLAMRADDDGFIQPKLVMRTIGSDEDDLKVLVGKRFLLPFDGGVVVIKHWLIHNMIRSDRYKPTRFVEQKKTLFIKPNKAYTDKEPVGLHSGNQMATQVRLGEVRLGKESKHLASPTATPQAEVFSLKDEVQKLYDSPRRDLNLIGWYFEIRKPDIRNKAQLQSSIRRHLRAAKELSPFTDDQLDKAWKYVSKEYPEYTLETITKKLTK